MIEADMLDLPFESERFDIVIEKGTMVSDGIHLVHQGIYSFALFPILEFVCSMSENHGHCLFDSSSSSLHCPYYFK